MLQEFKPTDSITDVTLDTNGSRLVIIGNEHTVFLWDCVTGKKLKNFTHTHSIFSAILIEDGNKLITGGGHEDSTIYLWDCATGEILRTFKGHKHAVRNLALSNNGSRFASAAEDKTARVWDYTTGKCLAVIEGFTSDISSVAFSQHAKGLSLAIGSHDNSVRFFQIKTHATTQKIEVQMLWNSHQNTLHLSGAKFEGAILSARNAALIAQRGAAGKPQLTKENTASTVTTVGADVKQHLDQNNQHDTKSLLDRSANTKLIPIASASGASATAAFGTADESQKALLFQHKTADKNIVKPPIPTLLLTPKQKLEQALQQCMTAIDKKPPSPAVALRRAAGNGREDVINIILECASGIDINQQNEDTGHTALHTAVLKRKPKAVKALLEAGASKDIVDLESGKTPTEYASESGDSEIQALFKPKMVVNL